MSAPDFAPDGYSIKKLLGSGGTAQVYLAIDNKSAREFALKTGLDDNPRNNQEFQRLINREFEIVSGLSYPGLVRVYENKNQNKANPCLVMQYCPGNSLDTVPIIEDPVILMNILSSIAINLYYLKLAGISHGDVKPHNIFLTTDMDKYREPALHYTRLSDFSLALKKDENQDTRLGLGTVGYMAPETVSNKSISHRSDLFALGVVAYQLAIGRHPFMNGENDPVRINAAIKEHNPPAPNQVNSNIPADLSSLILSLLEKKPENRPPDAFSLCGMLEKAGASFPYKRAIRPKHIIGLFCQTHIKAPLDNHVFALDETHKERLYDYCGTDPLRLRSILEVNFQAGLLVWMDGRLLFNCSAEKIIFPRKIQHHDCRTFHSLPYSRKKRIVLSSIAGGIPEAKSINIIDDKDTDEFLTPPLLYFVRNNVSPQTLIRFADKLADFVAEKYLDDILAATLYMKSKNLDRAYPITIDAANKLVNENKNNQAVELLHSLADLCRSKNDRPRLARILMEIGDIEKMTGHTSQAEKIYGEIIEVYKGQKPNKLLAETYKDLGDIYKMKKNYKEGINSLLKAKEIYESLDDLLELSRTLNNIGNIYTVSTRFDEALNSSRKALRIQRHLDAGPDMAITLNNIGGIYAYRGRYKRSAKLFKLALRFQRDLGNAREIARTLNNLGYVLYEMGDTDQALESLHESIGHNRKIGSKQELLINLENLTAVMIGSGKLKESVTLIKEGLNLADELNDEPMLAGQMTYLAAVQNRMGLYGKALNNLDQADDIYKKINDNYNYVFCLTEKAVLFKRLNLPEKAADCAAQAFKLATESDDKKGMIYAGIVTAELDKQSDFIPEALRMAQSIHSNRIANYVKLKMAWHHMRNKKHKPAGKLLDELSDYFSEGHSHIENAAYQILRAEYYLAMDNPENARICYEKAHRISAATGMIWELIEASSGLGKIYAAEKNYEQAFRQYKIAINATRTAVSNIPEDDTKKSFLADKKIASISSAVNELSRQMAKK